jgi:hypothetical protein
MLALRPLVLGVLLFTSVQRGMAGQDTVVVVRPGQEPSRVSWIEQWAVDFFNRPATTRVIGALTMERGSRYAGNVAVLNGPLVVDGVIEGDLVAINADVEIRSGAEIAGDVLVLGGLLLDEEGAYVGGGLRRYSERANVRLLGDRLALVVPPPREQQPRRRARYPVRSRFSLLLDPGGTYNRVEGLPLRLGAKLEWRSRDVRARIRGYGVFRTAGELDEVFSEDHDVSREDIGYNVDASIRFGRTRNLTLGGRYFDVVAPMQDWPLQLNEVGWATFLWHRDYRDYFLQRGMAGFVTIEPAPGVRLSGEVAQVEEHSIASRDPWTLFRRDEEWRPNPTIDEGEFTLISAMAEFDSRRLYRSRRSGVLLRIQWDRGIGADIVPRPLPPLVREPLPLQSYTWDRGLLDIRLYQRVDWGGQLRLRGFWAGTLGRDPLPIQRRYSLGGPDPMNGYSFRAFACNEAVIDSSLPGLCDHVLLFQAEYRGDVGFDWFEDDFWLQPEPHPESDFWDWDGWFWFDGPTVVLFSNAGAGWLEGEDVGALKFDIGAGIEFGAAGIYVAKALQEGEPVRWTLRIERRF